MPLYYITGGSGTGKSTALLELKRRGYEAYDVDEAGPVTAKWHSNKTSFIHPKSSVKAHQRTPEFLANHSWKVPRQEVEELAEKANNKTVFIGGNITNLTEIRDLCKGIFALVVDDAALTQRLLTRTNNDWGKSRHELQMTLDWNQASLADHKEKGHVIVETNRPIEKVVDDILSYVNEQ